MLTTTCTIEFADGSIASGSVAAITPQDCSPVEYRGAVHWLPEQLEVSDPGRLESFFQGVARETGGRLVVTRKGVYDFCGR
jgi:hypothetical protein